MAGLVLSSACSQVAPSAASFARVVYFSTGNTSPDGYSSFREGLREAGWVEGQNLVIEWDIQDVPDTEELKPRLADDLAQGGRVVLFSDSTPHSLALKQAIITVPVVVDIGDPEGSGVVSSLAHPGGNITGISSAPYGVSTKKLELFHEIAPKVRRLGVLYSLYSVGTGPNLAATIEQDTIAGQQYGMQIVPLEARSREVYDAAFEAFARSGGDAISPVQDAVTQGSQVEIAELAIKHGLASTCVRSDWVQHGCLMAYGSTGRRCMCAPVATSTGFCAEQHLAICLLKCRRCTTSV
jgi:putative ABC transport system substrate-binding protein